MNSEQVSVNVPEQEAEAVSAETRESAEAHSEKSKERGGESGSMGIVQGIPGRRISSVGVLDLRGVPAEQIAQIETISSTGVVLLDEGSRTALESVTTTSVGAVAVVGPDVRVMVEPWLEISRATVEGMAAGQKFLLVGIVFFKPDVPAALVTEKLESLQVVGILLACAGVQGALLGKMQITGVSVTLPDDVGPIVRSIGQTQMDQAYLSHLADSIVYLNIGQTILAADVTEEMLARKISAYYNVGQTVAPPALLALLKARCPTNLGQFSESKKQPAEEQAPAAAGPTG
jgi:hypothetical protein